MLQTSSITVSKLIAGLRQMPGEAKVYVQVIHDLDCAVVKRGPVYGIQKKGKRVVLLQAADDVS